MKWHGKQDTVKRRPISLRGSAFCIRNWWKTLLNTDFWGGYISRQRWKCAQLSCLFSFRSSTMVDGVMILPVLMVMAFPSPSWQGEWRGGGAVAVCCWRSRVPALAQLVELPGTALRHPARSPSWQRGHTPLGTEMFAFPFQVDSKDICCPFMYKIDSVCDWCGSCQGLGREMGNLIGMANSWAV